MTVISPLEATKRLLCNRRARKALPPPSIRFALRSRGTLSGLFLVMVPETDEIYRLVVSFRRD